MSDEKARAVAPVIGVILMVAITVILASIVGVFMLDTGRGVNHAGPTASLAAEDAEEEVDTVRSQFVVIVHEGGDPIDGDDLKIMVRYENNGSLVGTWDEGGWDTKGQDNFDIDGAVGYSNGIDYNGGAFSTGDTVTAGDRLTWYLDDDPGSSTSPGIEAGTEYRLTFIDTRSGQIVADTVVEID